MNGQIDAELKRITESNKCPDCGGAGWYASPYGIYGDYEQVQCSEYINSDVPRLTAALRRAMQGINRALDSSAEDWGSCLSCGSVNDNLSETKDEILDLLKGTK